MCRMVSGPPRIVKIDTCDMLTHQQHYCKDLKIKKYSISFLCAVPCAKDWCPRTHAQERGSFFILLEKMRFCVVSY